MLLLLCSSSQAVALKAEANAAFSAKDFVKANELYSKVSAILGGTRGKVLSLMNRAGGQAIELDPKNHVLWSNRSATKTSLRDYKGALEDADKVCPFAEVVPGDANDACSVSSWIRPLSRDMRGKVPRCTVSENSRRLYLPSTYK